MAMSGFCVFWRLDGTPVTPEVLGRCQILSPLWEPDHRGTFLGDGIGLVATERHITPEDAQGRTPYEHPPSGCVLVADSSLTYREELAGKLGLERSASDRDLILHAYLKWGEECCLHFTGNFAIVIWDPRKRRMFCATDHFGTRPLYYSHVPGRHFIVANVITPFRVLCDSLTIDEGNLVRFALDAFRYDKLTCYREITALRPARTCSVTPAAVRESVYWKLKDQRRSLPSRSREEHYHHFRDVFSATVGECLRGSGPLMAHISGGLDSSSVACEAARQLAQSNRTLHGFTAIPLVLNGPSHRKNWLYHEMPIVQSVLDQYPNIHHVVFRTNPDADIISDLRALHAWQIKPLRNVSNLHWHKSSLETITRLGGRTLITGQGGNTTLSWDQQSLVNRMRVGSRSVRDWMRYLVDPAKSYDGFYEAHPKSFLKSCNARGIMAYNWVTSDLKHLMMSQEMAMSSIRAGHAISLWHGVEERDPTMDVRLVEFCYNLPNWVFYRSAEPSQRRLLAREALKGIVPEAVRHNLFRGEQAADWYLQYNRHAISWRERLRGISPETGARLWKWYDRASVLRLFEEHPRISAPSPEVEQKINLNLLRFLSLAFYLDDLERSFR